MPEEIKAPEDPIALLNAFLAEKKLVIMSTNPKITFTDGGGVIVIPQFSVSYKT